MGTAYNAASVIRSGLVMQLDAANVKSYPRSGTLIQDVSGFGNNGTLVNGPVYYPTNRGIITLDGINDTIDCGNVDVIGSALMGLTVEVMVRPSSTSVGCIVTNGSAYNTNTFYLLKTSTHFTFSVYGTSYDTVYTNSIYAPGSWYHLTAVWSSGYRPTLYVNGISANGGRNGNMQTALINGNTNMFVGTRSGNTQPFAGDVSMVKLYDSALSATDVYQNFEVVRRRGGI